MQQCKCKYVDGRLLDINSLLWFPYKCVWIGYGTALKINKGNFGTRHFAACFVVFFARHKTNRFLNAIVSSTWLDP